MDLNLVRMFIAIAESRNLTDAARRSGMTRSNVSRRLGALEREYGAQLLRRTTRHVELTQAGRILYGHCQQAMNELQDAQRKIGQMHRTVSGEIRVRIPTGLGHFYLKPLILEFCKNHPELQLRLVINDQIHDLVASKVDLAIHITSAPLVDHVATKVCGIRWCLVCTPQYLQQHALHLEQPADLKQARLIAPLALGQRVEFTGPGGAGKVLVQHGASIQSGDYQFLFNAASQGLGIALLPSYAVCEALKRGDLVRVLQRYEVMGIGNALYVVRASNRQPSAATVAFIDLLTTSVRAMAPHWDLHDAP
ncbi:LysR family transcriptional regulator [Alicycliphilus denitrificans]|uniref:LysR family transcriptional regulator n=1 Tax=Alicycliphilus denitrificans TaxID=179636 RepID=UPI00095E86B3|nr:LysR family transcriptional regulator [Alicycliphilus denitrificans]MBN9573280.1 LysR family transcriptional regulator [Alicycliphilus denitrificans]OJW93277.1 MAG: LysR family transcriptional regulator [Alicycliphilus sp. 69-12]BCN36868.1 LysR family transcriptional regulator [Alicycliphilus denitrificans]